MEGRGDDSKTLLGGLNPSDDKIPVVGADALGFPLLHGVQHSVLVVDGLW